jgi:PEP-CTERM motif
MLFLMPAHLGANVIFYSGNLRTDTNVTGCGLSCTLGPSNTDTDYAQWAAVVDTFTVNVPTPMEAITYGYGGGTSLTGEAVAAGGLEPYLSLFDSAGDFLASTFFGITCPPGANSVGGNCFDVELVGGILLPGTYQIALSAFENMSLAENGAGTNLSDGFAGLGNLATGENLNYAFDVVLPRNVPEPGSVGLLALGLAALVLRKRQGGRR